MRTNSLKLRPTIKKSLKEWDFANNFQLFLIIFTWTLFYHLSSGSNNKVELQFHVSWDLRKKGASKTVRRRKRPQKAQESLNIIMFYVFSAREKGRKRIDEREEKKTHHKSLLVHMKEESDVENKLWRNVFCDLLRLLSKT